MSQKYWNSSDGLLGQPTLTDFAPWMNHSVPADSRDFSRPQGGHWMSTTPLTDDTNNADTEKDVNYGFFEDIFKKVKDFIRVGPPEEQKSSNEESAPPSEKEAPSKELEDELEKTKKPKTDNIILAFQSFFSQSHPIIGKLYDGPKDGIMNDSLKTAAQIAESKIAAASTPEIKGIIWNGKSFGTSPADVKSAIDLIVKHNGNKTSFLSRKERILVFSSLSLK